MKKNILKRDRIVQFAILSLLGCLIICIGVVNEVIAQSDISKAVNADRVLIRFNNGAFELLSVTPLRKVLPPTDPLPSKKHPISGFWYELLDSDGSVLYRRVIENPVLLVSEVPENSKKSKILRSEAVPKERVFSLLIPTAEPGDKLLLIGSPITIDKHKRHEPASLLASFSF
jgi:hypothetical protein